MIIPVTVLGVLSALSRQFYSVEVQDVLSRVPHTLLWVSLNVLIFSISNQRDPGSILEDTLNKPWRPIPSGDCSPTQARRLLLFLIPTVLFACYLYLGAAEETSLCLLCTWLYNDLGGADEQFSIRNGLNSIAYILYGSGALRVALAHTQGVLSIQAYEWLSLIAAIIFTTMQVQDLKDQAGDRARGRSTAPLDLGDGISRWSIAIGVVVWSAIVPFYWHSKPVGYVMPAVMAALVAVRVLFLRTVEHDKATYKAWGLWLMSCFLIPVVKDWAF